VALLLALIHPETAALVAAVVVVTLQLFHLSQEQQTQVAAVVAA
jgi:hypothetical protein